jgi:hypothetical protein
MSDKHESVIIYKEFGTVVVLGTGQMSELVYRRLDNEDEVWQIMVLK